MTYHNIESKKFPGHDYYIGYSPAGCVHIRKTNSSFGNWEVSMGNSMANREAGVTGKHVGYYFRLGDISEMLESLTLESLAATRA